MNHSALPSVWFGVCVCSCVCWGDYTSLSSWIQSAGFTLIKLWLISNFASLIQSPTLTFYNNSLSVSLLVAYISSTHTHTHTHTHIQTLVPLPNKQPWSTVVCWGIYAKRWEWDSIAPPHVQQHIPLTPSDWVPLALYWWNLMLIPDMNCSWDRFPFKGKAVLFLYSIKI